MSTKLPITSGKDVIKALSKAGFRVIRQKGSHVRLEKVHADKIIKLTVPLHKELKKGTLSRIIDDAGMSVEDFSRLLG
ncbi:MAG: type II toxin-antitoxin system HicA family toxin [Nitrosotalea sp.]